MTVERAVAALVGAACLLWAHRHGRALHQRFGTPVDVLSTFLFVWGAVLVLFAVPLIRYTPTALGAWVAIYGSLATTIAGCLLGRRLVGSGAAAVGSPADLRAALHAGRLRTTWALSMILGLIGFAAFAYAISKAVGWRALLADQELIRVTKRDSTVFATTYGPWKVLTYFNQIAFVLWSIALRVGAFGGRWRPLAPLGVVSLLPFFFTADRGLFAALAAWTILLHLQWPAGLPLRRLAAVGVACLLVGGASMTAIGNRYGGSLDAHPEIAAEVTVRAADPVVMPYLYLTANLPAFGRLTEDDLAPTTSGAMTVLPLVKLSQAAGVPGASPYATGVFYPIPFEAFSNYGWLGSFWLDFRLPGVLLLSALVGLVSSALWYRFARRPAFPLLWVTSLLLYVIAFSPLTNALSTTFTWQHLLLTPVLAVAFDRTVLQRWRSALRAPSRRSVAGAGAVMAAVCGLVASGAAGAPSAVRRDAIAAAYAPRLEDAVAKARRIRAQQGEYPEPLALVTRLQASDPTLAMRPLSSYWDTLPPAGVIGVYTQPQDLFLRVRLEDGRVLEVHRTEAFGGVTFGPGTRGD